MNQFHIKILLIRWTASENEITFWKKWPSRLRVKSWLCTVWDPFHERLFHCNSNSMKNWFYHNSIVGHHITTKFCTCHDTTTVMPSAKFHSDHFTTKYLRVEWNFCRIWNLNYDGKFFFYEMGPRSQCLVNYTKRVLLVHVCSIYPASLTLKQGIIFFNM